MNMEITLPVYSLIIISLGAIGVSSAMATGVVILAQKKVKDKSSYLLAVLLFICGFTLFNETLAISGITNRFKNLYFIPLNFSLGIAPLFYLFIKSKFTNKISKWDFLHIVVPIFQFCVFLAIGFQSIGYKSKLWEDPNFRFYINLESFLFPAGLVLYSILSTKLLNQSSDNHFFWTDDLKKWLKRLTQVFIYIALLELILFFGEYFLNNRFPALFYIFRSFLFVSLIIWIAFNSVKLLYPLSIFRSSPQRKLTPMEKTEAQKLESKLQRLMEVEKVYLNPELTIDILSNYLDTSVKRCSQFFLSLIHI